MIEIIDLLSEWKRILCGDEKEADKITLVEFC